MRFSLLLLLGCLYSFTSYPLSKTSDLLDELDKEIAQRQYYESQKIARLDSLKSILAVYVKKNELLSQYELREQIFEEYKPYVYDSAFVYANELLKTAYRIGDKQKIQQAKIKISITLFSAGMYKEALDTLSIIEPETLTDPIKAQYYAAYARSYYGMSEFVDDQYYSPIYLAKGHELLQKALPYYGKDSIEYLLLKAIGYMRSRDIPNAIALFQEILKQKNITQHQYAKATSSLSFMYQLDHQPELAENFLIQAAIADIRSSIRETIATRELATMLYMQGDIERAHRYIKIALEDASFYGARHRKIQVANILPIIEDAQLTVVEEQKKALYLYLLIMGILMGVIIVFAIIIFIQDRKRVRIQEGLKQSHTALQELNLKLQDSNRIKEEYIGSFFKLISEQVDKIEKIKTSVDRKLSQKKIDEIRDIVNSINVKSEREHLYATFDTIFLKIFPAFIEQFNAHFKKEDQFVVGEKGGLPPELRIFALIRLGINDNEKIARILDYSVNTIYTYKTKIKNKSTLSNEIFEEKLMEIRAL
ncbi:MAG TPA: DUF6377 domain-containing protein [Cytophagaceae bacterium]|nr:DUF6377 domain-containing protein [Cytophagaceae bacterium]